MYDAVIIGGGIGGIMAAYRLTVKNPNLKVAVMEKGHALRGRHCPIVTGKVPRCTGCRPCAIMEGMGGAGAFSDGKYVISADYGGWLADILPAATVLDYIEQADAIMVAHGATEERFYPDDDLKTLCLGFDLHMQQGQLKHLGTDDNLATMDRLITGLAERAEIIEDAEVTDFDPESREISFRKGGAERVIRAAHTVFAVGRAGSKFFRAWCGERGVPLMNNQIDIGVRVELPAPVWYKFSKKIYEPKISCRSKLYGDVTRMFCFNERGHVVTENTGGFVTVNGHAYKSEAKKSLNSNFALLSTLRFTHPFNEPIKYAENIAGLANHLSGGGVLVQRLGDLLSGRRTNEHRLKASTTRPTLDAVPGDLSLCIPKRQSDNIIETLFALDKVAPGTANHDTLLYGIECKYYSSRPDCADFEIKGLSNVYACGDGSGFTRSLSHAAANGLYVADKISGRIGV